MWGPWADLSELKAAALEHGSPLSGFWSIASFCAISDLQYERVGPWALQGLFQLWLLEARLLPRNSTSWASALYGLCFICPLPAPQALRQRWNGNTTPLKMENKISSIHPPPPRGMWRKTFWHTIHLNTVKEHCSWLYLVNFVKALFSIFCWHLSTFV